jgi:hypothetical protein
VVLHGDPDGVALARLDVALDGAGEGQGPERVGGDRLGELLVEALEGGGEVIHAVKIA